MNLFELALSTALVGLLAGMVMPLWQGQRHASAELEQTRRMIRVVQRATHFIRCDQAGRRYTFAELESLAGQQAQIPASLSEQWQFKRLEGGEIELSLTDSSSIRQRLLNLYRGQLKEGTLLLTVKPRRRLSTTRQPLIDVQFTGC